MSVYKWWEFQFGSALMQFLLNQQYLFLRDSAHRWRAERKHRPNTIPKIFIHIFFICVFPSKSQTKHFASADVCVCLSLAVGYFTIITSTCHFRFSSSEIIKNERQKREQKEKKGRIAWWRIHFPSWELINRILEWPNVKISVEAIPCYSSENKHYRQNKH